MPVHPALGQLTAAVKVKRGREALSHAREARRAVDALTDRAVTLARAEGATWKEIGAALGVSTQAAHKRWSGNP